MNSPVLKFLNLILRISPAPLKKPGALAKTGAATTIDAVDTKDVINDLLVTIPVSPRPLSCFYTTYLLHNIGKNKRQTFESVEYY